MGTCCNTESLFVQLTPTLSLHGIMTTDESLELFSPLVLGMIRTMNQVVEEDVVEIDLEEAEDVGGAEEEMDLEGAEEREEIVRGESDIIVNPKLLYLIYS